MRSQIISPLIWILTFFILLFAYSKLVGPIPFSVNSVTTQKSTTFDVTGEGKVAVIPDIASVNAGISAQAQTVKDAQNKINSVINRVSGAVKKLGVDSRDIQTANYSIYPDYDYSGGTQRIKGYFANTTLIIKVRDIDKVNSVIDASVANGANQISGINFEVDDKEKAENEAREKAVAEARKKAENTAKIAGFKLGRIINYSESFGDFPRPIPLRIAGGIEADVQKTQIEPGSEQITVTVTLSYEIQ